ncbi:MAG: hypothetical protein LH615_14970, partial [Ferruginibacter sp.]|nr:hypothetical protein [Ferruginibacter sp.]
MHNLKFFLVIILIFNKSISFSQNQNNIWYFGNKAGLNFNTNPPSALNDGVFSHAEGVSSVCDINGDLLFFTNGMYVWNANRQIMPNGFGLLGNNSSSQILIVPKPDDCNIYYIFTTPSQTFIGTSSYSVVDMRLDNGNGDISNKNIILSELVTERVSATLQSNGLDYWVVFQELGSNNFLSYSVNSSGVNSVPVISSAGLTNGNADDAVGCMKFSADGRRLCTANELGIKKCQLFDFDNLTGTVSNGFIISDNEGYGVEFSSDNTKLYISSYSKFKLTQYDLTSNNPVTIKNSGFVLADLSNITNENGGALQIASDNSIYVARNNKSFLGVIKTPNVLGAGCAFTDISISLNGKICYAGLPNFIKNYTGQFCGYVKANYTRATLCGGNDITINVTANFGTLPYQYSLNAVQFQTSNIFSNVVAGNYTITIKDAASNIRKITLNIPAIAKLTLNTSNKVDSDCGFSNGSILLSPSNGTAPFEYSKDGLNFQNSNSFNGLPASTIIFFVRDSSGCIASKNITIGTKSKLKIFAGRDTGIFINQTLALFAKDLTNSNFISFKWTPADGLDNAFVQNPTATITKNIDYTVEGTNAAGCS